MTGPRSGPAAWLRDPAEALMLLSRLPMPRIAAPRGARAGWAWPLAGLVIALPACAAGWGADLLGLPPAIAALAALGALVLTTGGLHEDGLADCADGFWGGLTAERRLAIMKDSRVGSYGVLALLLSVLARWTCLWQLFEQGPRPALLALLATAALSRGGMALVMRALPPARPDGLARAAGQMPAPTATAAAGLGLLIAAVLVPQALAGIVAGVVPVLLLWGLVARHKIGGQTGDVLGAAQQLAEIACLCALVA